MYVCVCVCVCVNKKCFTLFIHVLLFLLTSNNLL